MLTRPRLRLPIFRETGWWACYFQRAHFFPEATIFRICQRPQFFDVAFRFSRGHYFQGLLLQGRSLLSEVHGSENKIIQNSHCFCVLTLMEYVSYILSFQLYETAKNSRQPDADPIKFVELNGHHGHKMIFQSEKLPGLLRYTVQ